jgi:phage virion morphogenesis protein
MAKIDIDGDKELLDALNELIGRAQNLKPFFADIGEQLLVTHRDRWKRQEAPDGTPWDREPLSPQYLQSKRKKKSRGRKKILVLDGYLRKGLRYKAKKSGLIFGTKSVYAATHQFGRGEIPARPFLGLDNEDISYILNTASDFLSGEK